MNVIAITGRLGRDPTLRHVGQNNTAVATLAVAWDHGWGDRRISSWAKVEVWGKQGERVAQHLTKGARVGVTGEPYMDKWTDNEGAQRETFVIRAGQVDFLDPPTRREEQAPPPAAPPAAPPPAPAPSADPDDDVPF